MSLDEFNEWAKKFKKEYAPSINTGNQEVQNRYAIWLKNKKEIDRVNNLPNPPYVAGLTNLSDFTESELNKLSGSTFPPSNVHQSNLPTDIDAIDWRDIQSFNGNDVLTDIKNQGKCGSCFAQCAAEQTETAYILAGGNPVDLSAQYVANCDRWGSCQLGSAFAALGVPIVNQGLPTEQTRPYDCHDNNCNKGQCLNDVIHHTGPLSEPDTINDKATMLQRLKYTPLIVGIKAGGGNFPGGYKGGILEGECGGGGMDHSVQLVGYEPRNGSDPAYYILRNSWGPGWGIDGYLKVNAEEDSMCVGDYSLDLWSQSKNTQCTNNQCVPCGPRSECMTSDQCDMQCGSAPPPVVNKWGCNENTWTCEQNCTTDPTCATTQAACEQNCQKPAPVPVAKWQCHPSESRCRQDCLPGGTCFDTENECGDAGCTVPTPTNAGWKCNSTQGLCFEGCDHTSPDPSCHVTLADCEVGCTVPAPTPVKWSCSRSTDGTAGTCATAPCTPTPGGNCFSHHFNNQTECTDFCEAGTFKCVPNVGCQPGCEWPHNCYNNATKCANNCAVPAPPPPVPAPAPTPPPVKWSCSRPTDGAGRSCVTSCPPPNPNTNCFSHHFDDQAECNNFCEAGTVMCVPNVGCRPGCEWPHNCYNDATKCAKSCIVPAPAPFHPPPPTPVPAPSGGGGISTGVIIAIIAVAVIVAVTVAVFTLSGSSAAVAATLVGGQKGWFKNLVSNLI